MHGDSSPKATEKNRSSKIFWLIVIPIIVGIIVGVVSLMIEYGIFLRQPNVAPGNEIVSVFVRVQELDTGERVENAQITLELVEQVPTLELTDSQGIARFLVDSSQIGEPGVLIVEKTGYEVYTLQVDIFPDDLPEVIPLSRLP